MGGSMQTHSAQHGDFGRADANSRAKWDLHPSCFIVYGPFS